MDGSSEDADMVHIPPVQNTWTLGTILASVTSITSLLSMLIGGIWLAARLDVATKNIPAILSQQATIQTNVAVLQDQQRYTDMRYAEIMVELKEISHKIDHDQQDRYNGQQSH